MNVIKLLKEIKRSNLTVILMTAYGKKDIAVDAMKNICNGFIE